MLTRTQFLAISGFSEARFQSLTRRHLERLREEWDASPSEDIERWRAKRRKYVWHDVLILRTLEALTFNGGLSMDVGFVAAGNLVSLVENDKLANLCTELWGAVAFYNPEGRSHHVGTFAEIADAMRPAPEHWGGAISEVPRVVLVNLSNAARDCEKAANEAGFLVDWTK